MSMTSFDHFIETLDGVPAELQRTFTIMANLDRRKCELMKRINECVQEYRGTDKKDVRTCLYKESMDLFEKAKSCTDDKIELAMQTYDLVDKHIRRLEGLSGAQMPAGQSGQAGAGSNGTDASETANNKKNPSNASRKNQKDAANVTPTLLEQPLTVDMPLDPNEPRYCTCQQVSFGEMIACDNKECPIEWFHFACVDLKSKPKGKWYCPECFNANRKGRHKMKRL